MFVPLIKGAVLFLWGSLEVGSGWSRLGDAKQQLGRDLTPRRPQKLGP